jgi:1,4-dihydroxy-2-naphthoate octaprenyltransferase
MNYKTLFKISNPLQILFSGLLYLLGAGIPRYLGQSIKLISFILGLLIVWCIQLASSWLVVYFRMPMTPLEKSETPRLRERFRSSLIQASLVSLTLAGALIVSIFVAGYIDIPAALVLFLIIFAFIILALPPFQLWESGYGELLSSAFLGFLVPAFAYLLQKSELNRLLSFAAIPLMFIAIDYYLVRDFSTFASDLKLNHNTLLTRLSWQKAVPIHHLLLLAAYFLFAISPFLGIPWGLVWPVILSFPFGLIQIIWLQRISLGGPTRWKFIMGLAAATLSMAAYLLALSLWLR